MSRPAGGERVGTRHHRSLVVDSDVTDDQIDYQRSGTTRTGERAVPYHCPYCAEEDLRPVGATPGEWHCRACTRTFSVRYLGMQPPDDVWTLPAPTPPPLADPHPTGAR